MPTDPAAVASAPANLEQLLAGKGAELADTINAALLKAGEYLQSGADFAGEQAPLLIQEVLHYRLLETGLYLALGVLGLAWAWYAYRWSYRNAEARVERINKHTRALKKFPDATQNDTTDVAFSFLHYGIPISGALSAAIGFLFILCNLMNFLQVLVAPRVYLIEYFRTFIK